MAGHSKWANIQHRKGRQDEKRGKIWTRIIREITVAARQGVAHGVQDGLDRELGVALRELREPVREAGDEVRSGHVVLAGGQGRPCTGPARPVSDHSLPLSSLARKNMDGRPGA